MNFKEWIINESALSRIEKLYQRYIAGRIELDDLIPSLSNFIQAWYNNKGYEFNYKAFEKDVLERIENGDEKTVKQTLINAAITTAEKKPAHKAKPVKGLQIIGTDDKIGDEDSHSMGVNWLRTQDDVSKKSEPNYSETDPEAIYQQFKNKRKELNERDVEYILRFIGEFYNSLPEPKMFKYKHFLNRVIKNMRSRTFNSLKDILNATNIEIQEKPVIQEPVKVPEPVVLEPPTDSYKAWTKYNWPAPKYKNKMQIGLF